MGCGGPSLMLANMSVKHSVAYIWAWLWLEWISEMKWYKRSHEQLQQSSEYLGILIGTLSCEQIRCN